MHSGTAFIRAALLCSAVGFAGFVSVGADAAGYNVVASFNGIDGAYPEYGAPTVDNTGNVYLTTSRGGSPGGGAGLGTLVKVTPGKGTTVLHTFSGPPDGEYPYGGVLYSETDGKIFGTTTYGGTHKRQSGGGGTLYEVDPDGTYTVLHNFGDTGDGSNPWDAPVRDSAGNLYGITGESNTKTQAGTIWEYSSTSTYSVVHHFTHGGPEARLTWGKGGFLFGVNPSDGTVFFYNPGTGGYGVSAVFDGNLGSPSGDGYLVADKHGNLYGIGGGGAYGGGVVFRVNPYKEGGNLTVIHAFDPQDNNGFDPSAGLILIHDKLYGTTSTGGNNPSGCGVVFATGLKPHAFYADLHDFAGTPDGCTGYAGLAAGPRRYLYGDTFSGGESGSGGATGYGTVFRLRP